VRSASDHSLMITQNLSRSTHPEQMLRLPVAGATAFL